MSIYRMNFRNVPELGWLLGYPHALVLMVAISVLLLYLGFSSGPDGCNGRLMFGFSLSV